MRKLPLNLRGVFCCLRLLWVLLAGSCSAHCLFSVSNCFVLPQKVKSVLSPLLYSRQVLYNKITFLGFSAFQKLHAHVGGGGYPRSCFQGQNDSPFFTLSLPHASEEYGREEDEASLPCRDLCDTVEATSGSLGHPLSALPGTLCGRKH